MKISGLALLSKLAGAPLKVPAALAQAIRNMGSQAALRAPQIQNITEAAREAEKVLLARASLFGTPKPNLEVVPGIAKKLDTIVAAS